MGYLMAGLAGAGEAAANIAEQQIEAEFEERRQRNLQRIADQAWDRRHKIERADKKEDSAAEEEGAVRKEGRKLANDKELVGWKHQLKQLGSIKGDKKAKETWINTKVFLGEMELNVPMNKFTGEYNYLADPQMRLPTLSKVQAEEQAEEQLGSNATPREIQVLSNKLRIESTPAIVYGIVPSPFTINKDKPVVPDIPDPTAAVGDNRLFGLAQKFNAAKDAQNDQPGRSFGRGWGVTSRSRQGLLNKPGEEEGTR